MRALHYSLLILFFLLLGSSKVLAVNTILPAETSIYLQDHFGVSSFSDLLELKAGELGERRDKGLSLRERISLKLVQRHVRQQLKAREKVDLDSLQKIDYRTAGPVGFLLGILLGPLGVLIAYLVNRDAGNASWGGFAVWLFFVIFVL